MSDDKITKNEESWKKIFEKYCILENIKKNSFFEIDAKQIKEFREPRLMTKFDQIVNLPNIFKNNGLSILPITRGRYCIGNFRAYEKLPFNERLKIKKINLPTKIESIKSDAIYSESIALNCAYITGMINEIANEELFPTISGRMSTSNFDFCIDSFKKGEKYNLSVNNSQCEIDGGFEGEEKLILVEVKNFSPNDFIIRQLYYPFRLWHSKIRKEVIPVFMTFSNDIFSFYLYKFANYLNYNSINLIDSYYFKLSSKEIKLNDILNLFKNINIIPEPKVPFPQADSFERIIDLLSLLMEKKLTVEEITENYNFDSRQTDYYSNAGRYLGLISKKHEDGDIYCCLTKKGKDMMSKSYKEKYLSIVKLILEHKIFYETFKERLIKARILENNEIVLIMKNNPIHNVKSRNTFYRRSQTIKCWTEWILNLTNKFNR
ncbi:hypothetical protein ES708_01230 [subsurface metagenome]